MVSLERTLSDCWGFGYVLTSLPNFNQRVHLSCEEQRPRCLKCLMKWNLGSYQGQKSNGYLLKRIGQHMSLFRMVVDSVPWWIRDKEIQTRKHLKECERVINGAVNNLRRFHINTLQLLGISQLQVLSHKWLWQTVRCSSTLVCILILFQGQGLSPRDEAWRVQVGGSQLWVHWGIIQWLYNWISPQTN